MDRTAERYLKSLSLSHPFHCPRSASGLMLHSNTFSPYEVAKSNPNQQRAQTDAFLLLHAQQRRHELGSLEFSDVLMNQ